VVGTVKISYPKKALIKRVVGEDSYYIDEKSRLITTALWIGPHAQIARETGHYAGWDHPMEQNYSSIPDCDALLFDGGIAVYPTDILHQSEGNIIWRLFVGDGWRVFVNELYRHLFITLYGEHLRYRQLKADGPIIIEWVTGIVGQLMPGNFREDPLAVLGLLEEVGA